VKAHKGVNTPVRSLPWPVILERFSDRKPGMARFVDWVRHSDFSDGLFAITSLDTLIIGQSSEFDMHRNVIRISETEDRFRLVFQEDNMHNSERIVEESELNEAFRKLIVSLHWFANERINQ
jgi:hypothetical protein